MVQESKKGTATGFNEFVEYTRGSRGFARRESSDVGSEKNERKGVVGVKEAQR